MSGSFDLIHVLVSWKMRVRKFDDTDLGAVLKSGQRLPWGLPVDGFEGVSGPVVPFHELLAKLRAASCVSETLGKSSCDSFPVDRETGFGGWNERYKFGWF